METKRQSLAFLVPMFNERESIAELFSSIETVMASEDVSYQIICVDDGSTDDTLEKLRACAAADPRIRVIAFSRRFGKEAALTGALDFADADCVVPMDADLQDPPELVHDMVAKWREGFDVVYARRVSRAADTAMKRESAGIFYKLFNFLSPIRIPENVGDYRLMDRRVVEALRELPEKDRFMKGLFCWPGFSSTSVDYTRPVRQSGQSKFSYWKLWNFALSGITSFSTMPIRLGVYVGLLVSVLAFAFGGWILVKTLVMGIDVPGYASLMVVMLFLGGIQLFFMGLQGEYLGRIYTEVKNRPIYWVAETIGFERPGSAAKSD